MQDHVQARRDLPRPDDRPRRGSRAGRRRRTRSPSRSCSPASRSSSCSRSSPCSPSPSTPSAEQSIIVLVALLVCLIPTTIGALLSAIGIAGMDRLVQRNVLAMSGRAVEAAGDVNTLLLDKTGTITFGSRQAAEFVPVLGVDERRPGRGGDAVEPGRRDPGRALDRRLRRRALRPRRARRPEAVLVPFTAQTRMSGMDFVDGRSVRKGAADSVRPLVVEEGGSRPDRAGADRRRHLPRRRHPARRHRSPGHGAAPHPRRDPAEGHREAGHERAVRRAPGHGHPHDHGHRRQPARPRPPSRRRPASTTSWPRRRPRTRWR